MATRRDGASARVSQLSSLIVYEIWETATINIDFQGPETLGIARAAQIKVGFMPTFLDLA